MKTGANIDSELDTNSYELRVKYFQLFGAPIETDAAIHIEITNRR